MTQPSRAALLLLPLLLATALPARAGEEQVELKPGPGKEVTEANCSVCHSADYIQMNSPFLDRESWQKTVSKMITAYGAPISEPDAAAIVAYLSNVYGAKK